jgi:hypothetical protein
LSEHPLIANQSNKFHHLPMNHHGVKGGTVESDAADHGPDDAFRSRRLGCFNADQEFFT